MSLDLNGGQTKTSALKGNQNGLEETHEPRCDGRGCILRYLFTYEWNVNVKGLSETAVDADQHVPQNIQTLVLLVDKDLWRNPVRAKCFDNCKNPQRDVRALSK